MRAPTPPDVFLAHHRRAVAGERVARHDDEPQVGWWSMTAVRGGPAIPVRIYIDQIIDPETGELEAPETLRAVALREPVDPLKVWPRCRAISRAAYETLVELHDSTPAMAATHVRADRSILALGPTRRTA